MAIMIAAAQSGWTRSSAVAGAILLLAATAAGALVGATLGLLGALLSPVTVVVVWGAAGVIVASLVLGRPLLQRDRETPRRWLELRDWRAAAFSGALLGSGLFTRLGFWSFYALPLAAFGGASAPFGASVFAFYAAARVVSSWAIAAHPLRALRYRRGAAWLGAARRADLVATVVLLPGVIAIGLSVRH